MKTPEQLAEAAKYQREWRKRNPDYKGYRKEYREKHKDKARQDSLNYYYKNREKILARLANQRIKDKEERLKLLKTLEEHIETEEAKKLLEQLTNSIFKKEKE